MPVFGPPWHLIDPTHVRGFHPLNFDYFIQGREMHRKFRNFYFDFAFRDGSTLLTYVPRGNPAIRSFTDVHV